MEFLTELISFLRMRKKLWLAPLIIIMIILGGLTRLTESGLSMVDWKPIMGIMPPLSYSSWVEVFNQYKLSPEYKIVNSSSLKISSLLFLSIFLIEIPLFSKSVNVSLKILPFASASVILFRAKS